MFEIILVDFIFIMFPLSFYLFFVAYNQNIEKKTNNLLFDIALLTSLYLIIKFGSNDNHIYMFIINVPLIIAYYKKDNITIFLLSFLMMIYGYIIFEFNMIFVILEYISYYVIYALLFKNKKNMHKFTEFLIIMKSIFLSCFLWQTNYYDDNSIMEVLPRIIFLCIVIFVLIKCILLLMDKGEEILKYHMSLKELEQEKQIRMSLFKITHEIKNPLAVCKGYLDMVDVTDVKQTEKYVSIIKSEVDRTLILLQDFLCMNKTKIEKEPMDINILIEDVVHNFESIFKKRNIKCNLNLIDDEIYINGDYNRLTQVFINIIKNSIEAIDHDQGIINIDTFIEDECFHVKVEDNGYGMSSDVMKRITEPFYTTKKNGTGLGVSLSKEILSAHEATINYDSKEGYGTTVNILIPL